MAPAKHAEGDGPQEVCKATFISKTGSLGLVIALLGFGIAAVGSSVVWAFDQHERITVLDNYQRVQDEKITAAKLSSEQIHQKLDILISRKQ